MAETVHNTDRQETQELKLPPRAQDLLDATRVLVRLIEAENAALEARDMASAKALAKDKEGAVRAYHNALERLKNSATPQQLDEEGRTRLRQAAENFQSVLKHHGKILLRLRSVTEGIVQAVGEEARKQKGHGMAYGRNAAVDGKRAGAVPLALNQVI